MSDTRERILQAALAQYAELGIRGLTQPKVAKRAGVRGSHITYFFPKKADLLAAVLEASHQDSEGPGELMSRERFELLFAVTLEASRSEDAAAAVARHLDGFAAELARRYGVSEDCVEIERLVEELRGAGLRMLVGGAGGPGLDARAARLGLGLRTGFDDVDRYEAEIEALVPGYPLVHALAVGQLSGAQRVLVSGCGPGREVAALAAQSTVVAVDPSEAMRSATTERCPGVEVRADLPLAVQFDAALSLFVVHLIPAEEQQAYWDGLAQVVAPGGQVVVAWLHAVTQAERDAWCRLAARTLHPERVAVLRRRLSEPGPLHLQPVGIQVDQAARAGLRPGMELFHSLGVRAMVFERVPE